ncbi:hypothetical protein CYMTET_49889 [Cymbomonas tetramitiformis]|uniref:Uncharacterized protein n=1 Tax=Cymbomonas tetramitiformis TaxID=36881 RepID=A0AAE0BQZ7_9CHLO|nr:hypothetical protein CYMTET_49889 [Cymbomonas tetramitiformis]
MGFSVGGVGADHDDVHMDAFAARVAASSAAPPPPAEEPGPDTELDCDDLESGSSIFPTAPHPFMPQEGAGGDTVSVDDGSDTSEDTSDDIFAVRRSRWCTDALRCR